MTQEEKDLLLQDLCSRLPYGVKCQIKGEESLEPVTLKSYMNCDPIFAFDFYLKENSSLDYRELGEFKPYLFPLSSMTEGQKTEWNYIDYYADHHEAVDWLNKNHFDYRGLIEKSLALDATNLRIYE